MTSVTPRRTRVPAAQRRDQLLEVAEALFSEKGYAAASMDEVARRAGVTKPVIYDHFASKEALLQACVDRVGEVLARRVAEAAAVPGGPEARLRSGSRAFFAFVAEQRGLWQELAEPDAAAGAVLAEQALRIRRRQAALTVQLVTRSAAEAGVDVAVDQLRIEAVAHGMVGAYEALSLWWRDHPELTVDELTGWFVELVWPGLAAALAQVPSAPSPLPPRSST